MPALAFRHLPDRPVRLFFAVLYLLLASVSFLHQHYFLAGLWLWLVLGPLAGQQPRPLRQLLAALALGTAFVTLLCATHPN